MTQGQALNDVKKRRADLQTTGPAQHGHRDGSRIGQRSWCPLPTFSLSLLLLSSNGSDGAGRQRMVPALLCLRQLVSALEVTLGLHLPAEHS